MRRRPFLLVLGLAAGLAPAFPAPGEAQQDVYVVRSSPAWLGISYDARWIMEGAGCTPQVLVEAVVQGSPAERTGLRAGDAIVTVNGEPVPPGRLQALAARLIPGDSVRLRFFRNGEPHEVTAVADRRPDRPLTVIVEQASRLRSIGTPVIEVLGDTLVARNAAEWDPTRARAYWIREPDGRTEYRVIGGWSTDEMDRRVMDLLACAAEAMERIPAPTSDERPMNRESRVTLRQFQERADSLRVVYNLRALERVDSLRGDSIWVGISRTDSRTDSLAGYLYRSPRNRQTDGWTVQPTPTGGVRIFSDRDGVRFFGDSTVRVFSDSVVMPTPASGFTFRIEDHLVAGLRGVGGAELTALEPELAEYFRNADQGLLVLRVAPGTPADRAGLRPGDVVIAADGRRVESVAELRQIIALPTGPDVEIRVVRRGRTRDLVLRRD